MKNFNRLIQHQTWRWLIVVILSTLSVTVNAAQYCEANGGGGYEWIANIEVNDFTNPTGDSDYADYTHLTIELNEGNNAIVLTPETTGNYTEHWKIWIDLNNDGDFTDANEVVLSNLSGNSAVNGAIVIPKGTSVDTVMRVAMRYNAEASSPCGDIGDGEVEDYKVSIKPPTNEGSPKAVLTGPTTGEVGVEMCFNGDKSTDHKNGRLSYNWDLGDNTQSTEANVCHTYSAANRYTVSLTVTGTDSLTDTASLITDVNEGGNVDPTIPVFPSCDNLNIDNDKDGIPDCAEESGKYFYGMPVYDYGARKNQVDVFMEIDYMLAHELIKYDGTTAVDDQGQALIDYGAEPQREVFDKLKKVFAARGWVMHFDVGDLFDNAPGIDPDDYDLGGGNAVPFAEETYFYSYDDCDPNTNRCITTSGMDDYKVNHFKNKPGRDRLFYYIVTAVSHPGAGRGNTTGVAPDLFDFSAQITVGGEYWMQTDITSPLARNILINSQATMIMHEFGHIIGLSHGGSKADGNQNGKVNYHSIMNYMYTLLGTPTNTHSDISKEQMVHERYLSHHYVYANVSACADIAKQTYPDYQGMYHDKGIYFDHAIIKYGMGADPEDFDIDYSDGTEASINENSFNERNLYGGRDFNCDGKVNSGNIAYNLNRTGGNTTITDHNDWSNIHLYYRHLNYNENGEFQTTPNYEATSASHPSDIPGIPGISGNKDANCCSQNPPVTSASMNQLGVNEVPLSPAFFKNLHQLKAAYKKQNKK